MKPLIDKGDMATLTNLIGKHFDLEQGLNADIDAYIVESTMLFGQRVNCDILRKSKLHRSLVYIV